MRWARGRIVGDAAARLATTAICLGSWASAQSQPTLPLRIALRWRAKPLSAASRGALLVPSLFLAFALHWLLRAVPRRWGGSVAQWRRPAAARPSRVWSSCAATVPLLGAVQAKQQTTGSVASLAVGAAAGAPLLMRPVAASSSEWTSPSSASTASSARPSAMLGLQKMFRSLHSLVAVLVR